MKLLWKSSAVLAASLFALLPWGSSAQVRPRLSGPIDSSSRITVKGSHPPITSSAPDLGEVSPSFAIHGMSLVFSRSAAQQAALDALLTAQQTVGSPEYHQWLTPDQFAAEFGVADTDLATAENWLQQQGFTIDGVARSRNRIFFSGTAALVNSAFGTTMHNYRGADGATHFAPSSDISLPTSLASVVLAVTNLSSFRPHAHIKLTPHAAGAQFTSSVSGSHYLQPGDLKLMYDVTPLVSQGYTGVNQGIAIVGQSFVNLLDVAAFQSAAGISAQTPTLVLMPHTGSAYFSSGDEAESDLDLEYSSTMAPGAQIYFVYTGNNTNAGAFDALEYAVDERIAPIISSSYGNCEPVLTSTTISALDVYLQQAAAQGQTVLSAAGDAGSTDCYGVDGASTAEQEELSVDYPASSPYVTGMGGSEIPTADAEASNSTFWTQASSSDVITSLKAYPGEQVWNDDSSYGSPDSGGGGTSVVEARPSWQSGTIGGVAIPSGNFRLVPDISLVASNYNAPLLFCTSDTTAWQSGQVGSCTSGFRDTSTGDLTIAGGTSFDAPTFAGMLALMNQALNSTGQGLINPTLYSLAGNSTTYASAFHDITSGGNQCTLGATICGTGSQTTSYAAETGYDEASGLGSVDFNNLLTAWPKPSSASLMTSTTKVTAATTTPASGAADVVTITVAQYNPLTPAVTVPTGSVTISVDGTSAGSYPLTNGVATYTFSSTTSGSHVIVATYGGSGTFAGSTGSLALSVGTIVPTGSFALSANPSSFTIAPGATQTFTLTATPSSGYTGTVDISNIFYQPSTLNNFCASDTNGGVLTISGTAAATDTITFYTNASTCSSLGLQTAVRNAAGGTTIHLTKVHPSSLTIGSNRPASAPHPFGKAALPAALACLLLSFGFGGRSRKRRSTLARAGLSLAALAVLSLAGFGLTACSSSAKPSTTVTGSSGSSADTSAGTYTFVIYGNDSNDPVLQSQATVTMTVN
jgi:hypothetical protein